MRREQALRLGTATPTLAIALTTTTFITLAQAAAWPPSVAWQMSRNAGLDHLLSDSAQDGETLSQTVTVTYGSVAAGTADVCGANQNLPAVDAWVADVDDEGVHPTNDARGGITVTFTCDQACDADDAFYSLVMFDSSAYPYSHLGYCHWAVINIPCTDGVGTATDGTTLGGLDLLLPANIFPDAHAYNWLVFKQPGGQLADPDAATLQPFLDAQEDLQFNLREFVATILGGSDGATLVARTWSLFGASFQSAALLTPLGLGQAACGGGVPGAGLVENVRAAMAAQNMADTVVPGADAALSTLLNINFNSDPETVLSCGVSTTLPAVTNFLADASDPGLTLQTPTTSPWLPVPYDAHGDRPAWGVPSYTVRSEPEATFACTEGKHYTLLVTDAGPVGTPALGFAQGVRYNIPCTEGTLVASSLDGTVPSTPNMQPGGSPATLTFDYFPPSPVELDARTYAWWLWEQPGNGPYTVDPEDLANLVLDNIQGGSAFTLQKFRTTFGLGDAPVIAANWVPVATSLASMHALAAAGQDAAAQTGCQTLASQVGARATAQGLGDTILAAPADGVSALAHLVKVVWPAAAAIDVDAGAICGDASVTQIASTPGFTLEPLADNTRDIIYRTDATRAEPAVTFGCVDGGNYTVVLWDPFAQPSGTAGFVHWAVMNVPCEGGAGDIANGDTFGGDTPPNFAYLPPLNPEEVPHAYSVFVFQQTGGRVTPTEAQVAAYTGANGGNPPVDLTAFVAEFGLGAPVARNWLPLRNSDFSAHGLAVRGFAAYATQACDNRALRSAAAVEGVRTQLAVWARDKPIVSDPTGAGLYRPPPAMSFATPAATITVCGGKEVEMPAIESFTVDAPSAAAATVPTSQLRGDITITVACNPQDAPLTIVLFDPQATPTGAGQVKMLRYDVPCVASGGGGGADATEGTATITPRDSTDGAHGRNFGDIRWEATLDNPSPQPTAYSVFAFVQQMSSLAPTPLQVAQFAGENMMSSGFASFDLVAFVATFNLGAPVARSWINAAVSPFSAHMAASEHDELLDARVCDELYPPHTPQSAPGALQASLDAGLQSSPVDDASCGLSYALEVAFAADSAVDVTACGVPTTYAAFGPVYALPGAVGAANTFGTEVLRAAGGPKVTFGCDASGSEPSQHKYTVVLVTTTGADAMAGTIAMAAYDVPCGSDGWADAADGITLGAYPYQSPVVTAGNSGNTQLHALAFEQPAGSTVNAAAWTSTERAGVSVSGLLTAIGVPTVPVARSWVKLTRSLYGAHLIEAAGGDSAAVCAELASDVAAAAVAAGATGAMGNGAALTHLVQPAWSAAAADFTACGAAFTLDTVDAFSVAPGAAGTYDTTYTRGTVTIHAGCAAGSKSTVVVFDSGPVDATSAQGRAHALWYDCACGDTLSVDMSTCTAMDGFAWAPPDTPDDTAHLYHTLVFSQGAGGTSALAPSAQQVSALQTAQGSGAFDIAAFAADFSLTLMARNWVRLTNSPSSAYLLEQAAASESARAEVSCGNLVAAARAGLAAEGLSAAISAADGTSAVDRLVSWHTGKVATTFTACNQTLQQAAVAFAAPVTNTAPLTSTSMAGAPPTLQFKCDATTLYAVVIFDSYQPIASIGYGHMVKINVPCGDGGVAVVTPTSGGDVLGDFRFLPPANPFVLRHHYSVMVFEQPGLSPAVPQPDDVARLNAQNAAGAFQLSDFTSTYVANQGRPVAWTFLPLTASYWSAHVLLSHGLDSFAAYACPSLQPTWATQTGVLAALSAGTTRGDPWGHHAVDGNNTHYEPQPGNALSGLVAFLVFVLVVSAIVGIGVAIGQRSGGGGGRDGAGGAELTTMNPLDAAQAGASAGTSRAGAHAAV